MGILVSYPCEIDFAKVSSDSKVSLLTDSEKKVVYQVLY